MNLQGPEAQDAKILQSQNRHRAKIRLPVNGLRVVHGRLRTSGTPLLDLVGPAPYVGFDRFDASRVRTASM
jgi:hypothetical protein